MIGTLTLVVEYAGNDIFRKHPVQALEFSSKALAVNYMRISKHIAAADGHNVRGRITDELEYRRAAKQEPYCIERVVTDPAEIAEITSGLEDSYYIVE